MYLRRGI